MKKINILLTLAFISTVYISKAQVGIGSGNEVGDLSNTSGILSFGENSLGLVLPNVNDASSVNTEGAMLFDKKDKSIKYYNGAEWIALSKYPGVSIEDNRVDIGNGALISDKKEEGVKEPLGVLELSSNEKSLILPKIASPHKTLKNVEPGTICFDTDAKLVAIFNGSVWEFLK